jgi:hypothetical protein
VVSIIGCTGDWFGGWDGLTRGSADRFITEDLKGGRLPEVIARGEPAILVGHWPGFYFNGEEVGFRIFREVVRRLRAGYDNLLWMKLGAIARYWAARELTRIDRRAAGLALHAPFACPDFTVRAAAVTDAPSIVVKGTATPLRRVENTEGLAAGTWMRRGLEAVLCFDLPQGDSELRL